MDKVEAHEQEITRYTIERLSEIEGVEILGPDVDKKGGVVAFYLEAIHAHDAAQILDSLGIAVRAGHHCAQPLHSKFDLPATSRASMYIYNTFEEIDKLVEGIKKVKAVFA
jgi:cysteine desulfurase/selenocysteine lyase